MRGDEWEEVVFIHNEGIYSQENEPSKSHILFNEY